MTAEGPKKLSEILEADRGTRPSPAIRVGTQVAEQERQRKRLRRIQHGARVPGQDNTLVDASIDRFRRKPEDI